MTAAVINAGVQVKSQCVQKMKLLIKSMVSLRCKLIVRSELEKMHLHYTVVELGEVEIKENFLRNSSNNLKYLYWASG